MIVDIEEQISLSDIIKGVLPSELERFSRKYISHHTFTKVRDIAYYYLETYYNYPLLKNEKDNLIRILNRKIGRVIPKLIKEGLIEKYNQKTYKRIDTISKPIKDKIEVPATLVIPKGYTIKDYEKEKLDVCTPTILHYKDGSFKKQV